MNIQKISKTNMTIYGHVGNPEFRNREPHIDHTRTYLNYNISPNYRHRIEQLEYINEQVHKGTRKDAIVAFDVVTTLPQAYFERCMNPDIMRKFFTDIYDSVIKFFNLTEEDVVSSFVHLDERTPHMHEILTPIVRNRGERPFLDYSETCPLKKYYQLHPAVNEFMRTKGWDDINLLCGDEHSDYTEDVKTIKKRLMMEKEADIRSLNQEIASLTNARDIILSEDRELQEKIKKDNILRIVSENEDIVRALLINNLLKFDEGTRKDILSLKDDNKKIIIPDKEIKPLPDEIKNKSQDIRTVR